MYEIYSRPSCGNNFQSSSGSDNYSKILSTISKADQTTKLEHVWFQGANSHHCFKDTHMSLSGHLADGVLNKPNVSKALTQSLQSDGISYTASTANVSGTMQNVYPPQMLLNQQPWLPSIDQSFTSRTSKDNQSLVDDDVIFQLADNHRKRAHGRKEYLRTWRNDRLIDQTNQKLCRSGALAAAYSAKVFLGGVPWDTTEAELRQAFEVFGSLRVEIPHQTTAGRLGMRHRDGLGSAAAAGAVAFNESSNARSHFSPAKGCGYMYLVFDNAFSVNHLVSRCTLQTKHHGVSQLVYPVTAGGSKHKMVEVIPWLLSDHRWCRMHFTKQIDWDDVKSTISQFPAAYHGAIAQQVLEAAMTEQRGSCDCDEIIARTPDGKPCYTVFVGALHGMITADMLARLMDDTFGPVQFAIIDTDKFKYPIGSGRVGFIHEKDWRQAIREGFIYIQTDKFSKQIQIDPFIADSARCYCCGQAEVLLFCRHEQCFNYYCKFCFKLSHCRQNLQGHDIVMKTQRLSSQGAVDTSKRLMQGSGGGQLQTSTSGVGALSMPSPHMPIMSFPSRPISSVTPFHHPVTDAARPHLSAEQGPSAAALMQQQQLQHFLNTRRQLFPDGAPGLKLSDQPFTNDTPCGNNHLLSQMLRTELTTSDVQQALLKLPGITSFDSNNWNANGIGNRHGVPSNQCMNGPPLSLIAPQLHSLLRPQLPFGDCSIWPTLHDGHGLTGRPGLRDESQSATNESFNTSGMLSSDALCAALSAAGLSGSTSRCLETPAPNGSSICPPASPIMPALVLSNRQHLFNSFIDTDSVASKCCRPSSSSPPFDSLIALSAADNRHCLANCNQFNWMSSLGNDGRSTLSAASTSSGCSSGSDGNMPVSDLLSTSCSSADSTTGGCEQFLLNCPPTGSAAVSVNIADGCMRGATGACLPAAAVVAKVVSSPH